MNRILCTFLIACLLLSGCSSLGERLKEPVTFYYVRTQMRYFDQDGVFVSEEREASGHREDLSYLLALYLMGPTQEDGYSPLPKGTKLYNLSHSAEETEIRLSDLDDVLTDAEFSLACACLAKTCFGLVDTKQITLVSGERTLTLTEDGILQFDSPPISTEEAK